MTRASSERETTFRYAADEDHVSIFTAHTPTARKLERLGYAPYKVSLSAGSSGCPSTSSSGGQASGRSARVGP